MYLLNLSKQDVTQVQFLSQGGLNSKFLVGLLALQYSK